MTVGSAFLAFPSVESGTIVFCLSTVLQETCFSIRKLFAAKVADNFLFFSVQFRIDHNLRALGSKFNVKIVGSGQCLNVLPCDILQETIGDILISISRSLPQSSNFLKSKARKVS